MSRVLLLSAALLLPACALLQRGARPSEEEENKRVARALTEEVYNQRRLDRIPDYVAEDFVDLSPRAPMNARGPEYVRQQAEASLKALPGLRFDIRNLVAEDDLVLIQWEAKGSPESAEPWVVHGHSLLRMRDGKVVESWDMVDRLGALLQRGYKVIPPIPPLADEAPPRARERG